VHTVLPWEDKADYETLLNALLKEYAPHSPTEEHLVEEIAGVFWRKRRLRIAEGASYRQGLEHIRTEPYPYAFFPYARVGSDQGGADHRPSRKDELAEGWRFS
jgi:hypothetical protein